MIDSDQISESQRREIDALRDRVLVLENALRQAAKAPSRQNKDPGCFECMVFDDTTLVISGFRCWWHIGVTLLEDVPRISTDQFDSRNP